MSLFYVEKQKIYCEGRVVAVAEPLSGFHYREDWQEIEEGVFCWTRTVFSGECERRILKPYIWLLSWWSRWDFI